MTRESEEWDFSRVPSHPPARKYRVVRKQGYTSIIRSISVKVPANLLTEIHTLIEKGYYQSVSDFVRDAIRDLLAKHKERGTLRPELSVR